jgi:hypothetical protein
MRTSPWPCSPLAWLAASKARPRKGIGTSDPGLISYTLPEIRRLLISLIPRNAPDPGRVWAWSYWCRRRQYQVRLCHYRQRGYALT